MECQPLQSSRCELIKQYMSLYSGQGRIVKNLRCPHAVSVKIDTTQRAQVLQTLPVPVSAGLVLLSPASGNYCNSNFKPMAPSRWYLSGG